MVCSKTNWTTSESVDGPNLIKVGGVRECSRNFYRWHDFSESGWLYDSLES
jgi:hypothetical protein